jgi:acetyl esterase/lipase
MLRKLKVAMVSALSVAGCVAWVHAENSTGHPTWSDLRYAPASAEQVLDIYVPDTGQSPFPVVLQIHGGAFMAGDKRDDQLRPVLSALRRGYAVAAINYRLSGEAHFPVAVHDVKAATRWLRSHAAAYRLDARRIAAWGDSAGAFLAVLAGVSPGIASLTDLSMGNSGVPETLQAVVGWYGPYDFGAMDAQFRASRTGRPIHGAPDSAESRFLGGAVETAHDLVAAANPATYLSASAPPLLLQAGTRDPIVPVEQTENFARAARTILGPGKVTVRLLEGAGHGGPEFESDENLMFVLNWLDSVLK